MVAVVLRPAQGHVERQQAGQERNDGPPCAPVDVAAVQLAVEPQRKVPERRPGHRRVAGRTCPKAVQELALIRRRADVLGEVEHVRKRRLVRNAPGKEVRPTAADPVLEDVRHKYARPHGYEHTEHGHVRHVELEWSRGEHHRQHKHYRRRDHHDPPDEHVARNPLVLRKRVLERNVVDGKLPLVWLDLFKIVPV